MTATQDPAPRTNPGLLALLRPADATESPPGFSDLELDFFRRGDELDLPPADA